MRRNGLNSGCYLAICVLVAAFLPITGCVMGIPPPNGWDQPKVKPCTKYVTDGHRAVCMTDEEFGRWLKQNRIVY